VPERLVIFIVVIGQWHFGQGMATGWFQIA
jgi:hypothetical protein